MRRGAAEVLTVTRLLDMPIVESFFAGHKAYRIRVLDEKDQRKGKRSEGGCSLYGLFRMHSQRDSGTHVFSYHLLMVWQSTPKVVPRSRISRSAAPSSQMCRLRPHFPMSGKDSRCSSSACSVAGFAKPVFCRSWEKYGWSILPPKETKTR